MLNHELIEDRLAQIRISANRLKKMESISLESFTFDPDHYAIAEHHLRKMLESVFDIGRHIIAKKGLGKPANYSQIIELLGQQKIITPEFSQSIKGMAGYRNRLVHEYAKITPEEVFNIIKTRLNDFAQFCTFIVQFLERENNNVPFN
ncbi:MAG: DUF86 domain-containing protein [Bacillota bacterium]